MAKLKGMIFDMDGTIIDTTRPDYDAWEKAFSEYKVKLPWKEYIDMLGMKSSEIVKKYLDLSEKDVEKLIHRKEEILKKDIEINKVSYIEGAERVLTYLKGRYYKLALATGAQKEKLDFILEQLNFAPYFDEIITADEVNSGKPDPEMFLKAAEKLKLKPEQCLVWEDSTLGVQAAKAGGFRCIAITTTRKKDKLLEADAIVDNFTRINLDQIMAQFQVLAM
jgi:beta-phosphoglucomutase